jgi:hypothetical protein
VGVKASASVLGIECEDGDPMLWAAQTLADLFALADRMRAAGWDDDAALGYLSQIPLSVLWMYPVAVPPEAH